MKQKPLGERPNYTGLQGVSPALCNLNSPKLISALAEPPSTWESGAGAFEGNCKKNMLPWAHLLSVQWPAFNSAKDKAFRAASGSHRNQTRHVFIKSTSLLPDAPQIELLLASSPKEVTDPEGWGYAAAVT